MLRALGSLLLFVGGVLGASLEVSFYALGVLAFGKYLGFW